MALAGEGGVYVQEMEIGPSVTGSSPFALLPEILPLLTKGLGTQ